MKTTRKTKRTALRILTLALALTVWATVLSAFVSAAETLSFKDVANANGLYDDGGYYILDGTGISVTATEAGGIEIEGNGYCTWAFVKSTVEAYPYLVYTIADDAGNGLSGVSGTSYYAGGYILDLPATPGTHVVNLLEEYADQADVTLGYYYVLIWASGSAKTYVDEIYLSSAAPEEDTGNDTMPATEPAEEPGDDPSPATFDGIAVAVSLTLAASAAAVALKKKR